jgi:hypothetical protein
LGNLADCKSTGKVLRQDEDFVIVRTYGTFEKDWKFWLDNGKMVGTSGVSGYQIVPEDLQYIRKKLGFNSKGVKNSSPSIESNGKLEMALQLGVVKKKSSVSSLGKNGNTPHLSPGEEVNEVIKRGPGRPKKATEELPETKPSPKAGKPVESSPSGSGKGTGKRGRPAGSLNRTAADKAEGKPAPKAAPKTAKIETESDTPGRARA